MDKKVIVFFMLGSDHLANVRSLQNIYQQTYDNITLVAIDDCCDGFQNERFFYNFEDKPHDGVQQIVFIEEKFPRDENCCKRNALKSVCGDFMVTVRAGDRFVSRDSLEKAVNAIKENPGCSAVVTGFQRIEDAVSNSRETAENSLIIYKIENWIDCFDRSDRADSTILNMMYTDGMLSTAQDAMCIPGHIDCFRKPDYKTIIAYADDFYKSKEEQRKEKNEVRKNKIIPIMYKITHIRMIVFYGLVFGFFCASYVTAAYFSISSVYILIFKYLSVAAGIFAFLMFTVKVVWRLRREGKI